MYSAPVLVCNKGFLLQLVPLTPLKHQSRERKIWSLSNFLKKRFLTLKPESTVKEVFQESVLTV